MITNSPTVTTAHPREATFYIARCDELVRLLLRLLEGATRLDTLRFADRQRLKRLLKRLQEGIQQLNVTL